VGTPWATRGAAQVKRRRNAETEDHFRIGYSLKTWGAVEKMAVPGISYKPVGK